MDWLSRIAEKLPVKDRSNVAQLRLDLAQQAGDRLALSHVQLHNIYSQEGRERHFLAGAYRHLARYHLEEALVCAKFWPEPWGILGEWQVAEGDLGNALQTLSKFVQKERLFIQFVAEPKDDERLRFCHRLASAASTRCQLGQFAQAREWFTEALGLFRQISTEMRIQETELEDAILLGISGCLMLEFRYAEAKKFIDEALEGQIFSAYQSRARHALAVSRGLLPELADATRNFDPLSESEDLWAELMQAVELCDGPEKAREVRRKILEAIKVHDANRHVQALAGSVKTAMMGQLRALENAEPHAGQPEIPTLPRIDLSQFAPEDRDQVEEISQLAHAFRKHINDFNKFNRALNETARRLVEGNVKSTQDIAESVYQVPLRYQAAWVWWSGVRFIIRIALIAYVLGKLFEDFLEKQGRALVERLEIPRGEIILLVAILLVGLAIDSFAEKMLDKWNLPKYKRLLTRIVANRAEQLWLVYNTLRKLLLDTNKSLGDLEKQLQSVPGAPLSS